MYAVVESKEFMIVLTLVRNLTSVTPSKCSHLLFPMISRTTWMDSIAEVTFASLVLASVEMAPKAKKSHSSVHSSSALFFTDEKS